MGETNASRLRRETRLQRTAPQDRAAGGGFIRGKKQRILSLFQAPGFRHGVNSLIQNPKSKIE